MKLEGFVNVITANASVASIVTCQHAARKATFRSAYLTEAILKIAVRAKSEGFDYEIVPAQRAGGLLAIVVTPRQIPVSAKYDDSRISMLMTPYRETDV
jgi:hypothetical protein